MPPDPASVHTLAALLSVLNDEPGSHLTSDANTTPIDLMCQLLSREDYVNVAELLDRASDVENMLDLILQLLRDRRLPNKYSNVDAIHRRARRFMFKITSKIPVIPPSLIVTGVNVPNKRDYIGGGGFGQVFKGELRGEVVALKILHKSDNQVAFCREALMWRSLKHKFLLPFLGIHELEDGSAPQFLLVSPYMMNGTLAYWRKKGNPPKAEIEKRILEVAQGMEYIHSEGAVHGDLRGENVLLDANLHVQITDFGLTRLSEATNTQSGARHVHFSAPELFGFSEGGDDASDDVPARTQMSDVYAFGCLYYEIHYDRIPYFDKQDIQIWTLVSRGILPARLDEPHFSDEGWQVVQRCWARKAAKRPSMNDVTKSLTQFILPDTNDRNPFFYRVLRKVPSESFISTKSNLEKQKNDDLISTSKHPAGDLHLYKRNPEFSDAVTPARNKMESIYRFVQAFEYQAPAINRLLSLILSP